MVRGLIFGVIWGGIFTALFLAAVSLMSPLPDASEPVPIPEPVASTPGVMPAEDPTPTPQISSPTIEESPALAETTSAIVPSTGAPENELASVSETNEAVPLVSEGDAPTSISTQNTDAPSAPSVDADPMVSVETVEIRDETPSIGEAVAPLPEEEGVKTFTPDAPLEEDSSVVTNRLPTIQPSPEPEAESVTEPMAEETDDRPLMAIILIDTGEFNIGPDALASFPYPMSFAIDPLREDAIEVAQVYQDKGFELLAIADLPQNGDKDLASVALAPTLDSIPGVDGVLEGSNDGLQGNMELSEGVLNLVSETGLGLVLRSKGLNAAQQQASGRDLPVKTLFRDFDANGQDATVIRRFLDQAAFKARQEGSVIMVGRLRPATISALLLWGLQDRASSVRLVPVTDVLDL